MQISHVNARILVVDLPFGKQCHTSTVFPLRVPDGSLGPGPPQYYQSAETYWHKRHRTPACLHKALGCDTSDCMYTSCSSGSLVWLIGGSGQAALPRLEFPQSGS
jgi:hypothetical protein